MGICIVGLGPGPFGLISVETWEVIRSAGQILLRTARHPAVAGLDTRDIRYASYDWLYEDCSTFDAVYQAITDDVISRGQSGANVVYAVPGSPLVAEKTVELIREQAVKRGVDVTILPGMSFLDVLWVRLGVDPANGITVLDSCDICRLPAGLATGLVITQVYNRQVASDAKLSLMELFPDDYRITVVSHLGLDTERIREIPLFELDRLPDIDHLTSVYVPARETKSSTFTIDPLVDVMACLRSPGGCVWDIEQTHASLRRYIVEEVYEVLEAIDEADGDKLCEELGDLLLQIVFHARIAEEADVFSVQDVIDGVTEKMIRRHPHVFGDITVRNAAEVVVNWEKIKQKEKGRERISVLDGIPKGLPSLMRAYKLQSKAAKVGFDWEQVEPVWAKIREELAELSEAISAGDNKAMEGELGDVLFAVVNLARWIGIDPETALNVTNNKFGRRFSYIEENLKQRGVRWEECTLAELDKLWEIAKNVEKK